MNDNEKLEAIEELIIQFMTKNESKRLAKKIGGDMTPTYFYEVYPEIQKILDS